MSTQGIADLEADIAALRATAERAGMALACLFTSADEFEADIVRVRREQGAYQAIARANKQRARHPLWAAAMLVALVLAFLLV